MEDSRSPAASPSSLTSLSVAPNHNSKIVNHKFCGPLVIATGRRLKLQQLDQAAALQTLADIARDNPALDAAPEPDRLRLITETGGNTLLLTWTAWQVGSGYCTTIADALAHLRSCPPGNDPLQFIFGGLLARFTREEERIVASLSYPTEPVPRSQCEGLESIVGKSGAQATIWVLIWKFLNPRHTRMNALLLLAAIVVLALPAVAAPPVVSNVRAAQLAGTKNIEVLYDVSDADGDLLTIAMQVSGDAGQSYTIPATALSGHIGSGVTSGANRRIIWNAAADWNGQLVSNGKVRVTASDGTTPAPPPGMAYIPAGSFQMGDNLDGVTNALPVHNVYVDAFFLDRFEVTKELWQGVQAWSTGHGYSISVGSFKAAAHPVHGLSWYDCVKWCNARSEKEGLTPCYYTSAAQTTVYRTGPTVLDNAMVNWFANGYRLPTEAEWEKGARGGTLGQRYPWGNGINGSHANYNGSGDAFEINPPPYTTPVGYYNGSQLPAGVDVVNGYNLYDMGGNLKEWCWDWYSSSYYGDVTANINPYGPPTGTDRLLRSGSWNDSTSVLRCAYRVNLMPSYSGDQSIGFRCARRL